MGFISKAKAITVYPNSDWVEYALDVIGGLGLVAAVMILMCRRGKGRTIAELAERLSGGETELARVEE